MIWKILRPHYWAFTRSVQRTHRFVAIGLLVALVLGGLWFYQNVIVQILRLLSGQNAVALVAPFLPLVLVTTIMFGILQIGDVVNILYVSSDLERLMVAPISQRSIFIAKLFYASRATLTPALIFGALFILLGIAQRVSPVFYPLIVLLLLGAMTLATALVTSGVMLLVRVIPAQRIKQALPIAVALLSAGWLLGQQSILSSIFRRPSTFIFFADILLNPSQLAIWVAAILALTLFFVSIAYGIFNVSFHEGWNRYHEEPIKRRLSDEKAHRTRSTRLSWVRAPLRHFLIKEWLEMRRDPQTLINLIQPLVLIIITVTIGSATAIEALRPILFWGILLFLILFMIMLPIGTSLLSVMQEGRNMARSRSLPVSLSDMLKAKFWATWLPMLLAWTVVLTLAGVWLRLSTWQVVWLDLVVLWGLSGTSLIALTLGTLLINFTVEDVRKRMPSLAAYGIMLINLIFILCAAGILIWLAARLFPDSAGISALHEFAGFAPIAWLLSDSLLPLLAMLSAQIAFVIGIKRLWAIAVQRLERWEES